MISRSSCGFRPTRTSTCEPGMRSRIALASGESSSLIRMRMTALPPQLGPTGRSRLGHGGLGSGETLTELHLGAQVRKAPHHRADHNQTVEVVEVAQVGDAEDPSLGRVLPADELDPVLLEEVLDKLLRVGALGRKH